MNTLKLVWIRKFKTSTHEWKHNVIAAVYPEMLLFGQLASAVPYVENHNTFLSNVFQAYGQLAPRKKQKRCLLSLFFAIRILRLEIKLFSARNGFVLNAVLWGIMLTWMEDICLVQNSKKNMDLIPTSHL